MQTDDSVETILDNDNGERGNMNETMRKIESSDPESHSAEILTENIQQLKALFPELVTEGPEDAPRVSTVGLQLGMDC